MAIHLFSDFAKFGQNLCFEPIWWPEICKKLKKFRVILRASKRSIFKIFCPPLRSGRLRRLGDLKDFLKRRGSPFPLHPPPKSSLCGSISPMFLSIGGRKNQFQPKIFKPKKIICWLCKIWSKLVFLSLYDGLKYAKIWKFFLASIVLFVLPKSIISDF